MLLFRDTFLHRRYWRYVGDFIRFRRLSRETGARFKVRWADRQPMLNERGAETAFDAHYTYHPAWAARIVADLHPSMHIDIGSALQFATIVSAFVPVDFYDFRPASLSLSGLASRRGDLARLPFDDASIESISCMHVVEHVGLGRYGDPLDPSGDLKAMAELQRVLAERGSLLFVVPVGKPCLRYNAHRIYAFQQVMSEFSALKLRQFSLIDDKGSFIPNARPEDANAQLYGCGCWWFIK